MSYLRPAVLIAVTLSFGLAERSAATNPYIDFGQADPIAVNQPIIQFELVHEASGETDGPTNAATGNVMALVDTAAQGIIVAGPAYEEFDGSADPLELLLALLTGTASPNLNPDLYRLETDPATGDPVTFEERGVSGTRTMQVFQEYRVRQYESDGDAVLSPVVRPIGDPTLSLSFFGAVIGTASLEGSATTFDHTTLTNVGSWDIFGLGDTGFTDFSHVGVSFSPQAPAPTADTYHIDMRPLGLASHGPANPGDPPAPTFGDLYAAPDVTLSGAGGSQAADMIVDSGAQLTIIFPWLADIIAPEWRTATDSIDIGGFGDGPPVSAPLVLLDQLVLPTREGVDLKFNDIEVAVVEIEGLNAGGILGYNILASGYLGPVLESIFGAFEGDILDLRFDEDQQFDPTGESLTPGAFHQVVFDLTDPNAPVLALNVNPGLNNPVPEPASIVLVVAACGFAVLRRSRRGPRRADR